MEGETTGHDSRYWLEEIIDLLASEYGWDKDFILNRVYPDEALVYGDKIRRRRAINYRMELLIAHNPNSKTPSVLFNNLNKEIGDLRGSESDKLDKSAFAQFKKKIAKESKNIGVGK